MAAWDCLYPEGISGRTWRALASALLAGLALLRLFVHGPHSVPPSGAVQPGRPTLYVFYPGALTTGGPATLHAWHAALVGSGFASRMFSASLDAYREDWPNLREIKDWPPANLRPGDAIVVAEHIQKMAAVQTMARDLHAKGVRVIVLVLGLPFDPPMLTDKMRGWGTLVPLTRRMARLLSLTVPGGLTRPMQPRLYRLAELARHGQLMCDLSFLSNMGIEANGPVATSSQAAAKRNLIVMDHDMPVSYALRDRIKNLLDPPLTLYVLKAPGSVRLNSDQMACLYAASRVYLDGGIPGFERGPMEAAMLGSVPVLPSTPVPGIIVKEDIPTPPEFQCDFANETDVFNAVRRALNASLGGMWSPTTNPVSRHAERLRNHWPEEFKKWTSTFMYHGIVEVGPNFTRDNVARFALNWIIQHPLSTLHVLVDDPLELVNSVEGKILALSNVLGSSVRIAQRTNPQRDPNGITLAFPADLALPDGATAIWLPQSLMPISDVFVQKTAELVSGKGRTVLAGGARALVGTWDLVGCDDRFSLPLQRSITVLHAVERIEGPSTAVAFQHGRPASQLKVDIASAEIPVIGSGHDPDFYVIGSEVASCQLEAIEKPALGAYRKLLWRMPQPAAALWADVIIKISNILGR